MNRQKTAVNAEFRKTSKNAVFLIRSSPVRFRNALEKISKNERIFSPCWKIFPKKSFTSSSGRRR